MSRVHQRIEIVEETPAIRILLADDHDILRQGLKLLFEVQPDMQIVGEARTGKRALEQTERLRPDIVIMDISMAEMDGLKACRAHSQALS